MALAVNTRLPEHERAVLRLLHVLETDLLGPLTTAEAEVFRLLAAKACNESVGFIGCLRAGSFGAAHHHLRSLLEIYATTHHLVCKPTSQAKRFERFTSYSDLVLYQAHLRQRARVEAGTWTEDEFEASRMVSIANVERLEPMAARWRKLYKREDLLEVRHWHAPSSIEQLFGELDDVTEPGEEPPDYWRTYELVCHAIHVSPIGHRAVGIPGIPLFGLPDDGPRVNHEIDTAAGILFSCIVQWDRSFVSDKGLLTQMTEEIQRFRAASARTLRRQKTA